MSCSHYALALVGFFLVSLYLRHIKQDMMKHSWFVVVSHSVMNPLPDHIMTDISLVILIIFHVYFFKYFSLISSNLM